jgi:hypothetical protein
MKKSCTLFLQRNLPDVTEKFAKNLLKHNDHITDLYVIESGSDKENITDYPTFHADWKDAVINGLRTGRGFNYGLKCILEEGLNYEYVLMATGDTQFNDEPVIEILIKEMEDNPRIGIISPITWNWGERISNFVGKSTTKAISIQIPHICWLFRRECLEDLTRDRIPNVYDEFLYDGTNFRCYGADTEIMMNAYKNNWMFAITSKASHKEDYDLTHNNYIKMKTDSHSDHRRLMWEEGLVWIKKKLNLSGKVPFNSLLKKEYDSFFERNPDLGYIRY